jgi:hypothetical protein
MTPLHWAAILGQPDLVALLLKHGASNNISSGMGRPLHVAAMSQEGVRQWLAPGIASLTSSPTKQKAQRIRVFIDFVGLHAMAVVGPRRARPSPVCVTDRSELWGLRS